MNASKTVSRRRAARPPDAPRSEPRLLREDVYDAVRGKIVAGELHPGQFLGEEGLASRLGTSRTPVREALVRLQRDGLVEMVPHRGAFVRWPTPKDVEDVFDIRVAVEGMALRKALPRLDAAALRSLLERLERQAESVERLAPEDVEALSVDVHMSILHAARNERVARLVRQFREQIYDGSALYRTRDGRLSAARARRVITDHRDLVLAILGGNPDEAVRALERHLATMKEMVIEALRGSE